ncbi:iron-sulfur protein [Alloactinosynnema sp. L-07]|uniref:(2Fe-2S)-binding protein n=1 Tax=Alloactinosynnema sp. L-07 TaxID=1653480 RepID=UPI00065EF85A|nr:(2Fe-2S)-binding protein [Alloactinosynnema sp. L-07]CRK61148.1 iron-sulfur protein [Alloactinosynnema sp. L-07]
MTTAARLGQAYLAASVHRINSVQTDRDVLRFGLPADPAGWMNCEVFLNDPAGFSTWRADLAGWLDESYGESPDRTVSGYLMTWYLSVPAYAAGLLFHHERRVPSIRPSDLAFHRDAEKTDPDTIALLSPYFVCLPDDPAAGTPQAVVVADEQALAAVLRGRFRTHAAQFIARFGPQVRFGNHTLWAAATDALEGALWLAGRTSGDEGAGVLDAALALGEGRAPFTSASNLRPAPKSDGPTQWTRRRESCCFHYLLDSGGGECSTCPRLSRKL